MMTPVDGRLRQEAQAYRLRFACPHCVYFDPASRSCSEGYPTEEHERTDFDRDALLFCKLFEGAV